MEWISPLLRWWNQVENRRSSVEQIRIDERFAGLPAIAGARLPRAAPQKSLDNRSSAELGLPAQCKQLHFPADNGLFLSEVESPAKKMKWPLSREAIHGGKGSWTQRRAGADFSYWRSHNEIHDAWNRLSGRGSAGGSSSGGEGAERRLLSAGSGDGYVGRDGAGR